MVEPPVAARRPVLRTHHGQAFTDDYDWLRDPSDPAVAQYLEAENAYTQERSADLEPLRRTLFEEIRSRTLETDLSVPAGHGAWWYYTRTVAGAQYTVACRSPRRPGEPRPLLEPGTDVPGEQVLADGNVEAGDGDFFDLGACEVSIGTDLVALAMDFTGDERYDVQVRRIADGVVIDDTVRGVGPDLVWSHDDRFVFYTRLDPSWRPHEVWRHEVGTDPGDDVLVHAEPDERFWLGVGSSRDDRWVYLVSASKTTSEVRLVDATHPTAPARLVAPRRPDVEYFVEVAADRLLITHNAASAQFELSWAPLGSTGWQDWQPVPVVRPGERLLGVDVFDDFAVAVLRRDGLSALRVLPRDPDAPGGFALGHDIVPAEPIHTIGMADNLESDVHAVQVVVESLVSPRGVFDYDVRTRQWTLLRRRPVLGGYDPADYLERREWARAADGTMVPISLVHRRDVADDGTAPGLLYGYGAYEIPLDPWFSVARLGLLDRGLVVAIAHVRGGGELGRSWYEQGRRRAKMTSVTDFVACADRLVEAGWVAPGRLAAEGGSAGGLLVGAAAMTAPERFAAVLAEVPFVDPLTSMLDPSAPLTVVERDEWGDPLADPAAYADIAAYSPYESVTERAYPALLATASLHDTRVSYAEPAKWVARLRAVSRTDEQARPILLRTEMSAGHGGRSGRYDAWHELAFQYAFLLDRLGATELLPPLAGR